MLEPVSITALSTATVSEVGKAAAENLGRHLSQSLINGATALRDQVSAALQIGFQKYLEQSYDRCRKFKSILDPTAPLDLKAHYVNLDLICAIRERTDIELIAELHELKSVVITGLAGSGKSMFMRYLTLVLFETTRQLTPLFVELRHLNKLTDKNLLAFMRNLGAGGRYTISEAQFGLALDAGAFLLILDGFDELNHEIRDSIQAQILALRSAFPKTPIVISSRPDERFEAWQSFYIYSVKSLSKQQSLKLIKSLPYNEAVKKRFADVVNKRLYESHESFLSSPLLATIMLLTYESFAQIPSKMYVFYGQAFDTLFQKHDAQKEQFSRKSYSSLELEDFKECFSAFCALSYLKEAFSFSKIALGETSTAALAYVKTSKLGGSKRIAKKVTSSQFTTDLFESVCMLQRDGIEFSFVHRSFQEYFGARFVTTVRREKIKPLLDDYCRRSIDSVIPMVFDMYREPIEQEWVGPAINEIRATMKLDEGVATGTSVSELFSRLSFIRSQSLVLIEATLEGSIFSKFHTLCRIYPDVLGSATVGKILRPRRSDNFAKLVLSSEFSHENFFNDFDRLMHRPHESETPFRFDRNAVGPEDSWWLNELGFGQMLQTIKKAFDLIQRDINSRTQTRESILSKFL
jgi:hypothetical protein